MTPSCSASAAPAHPSDPTPPPTRRLQQSTCSQYQAPLGWWLQTFCCWCPPEEREALRTELPRLQLAVRRGRQGGLGARGCVKVEGSWAVCPLTLCAL